MSHLTTYLEVEECPRLHPQTAQGRLVLQARTPRLQPQLLSVCSVQCAVCSVQCAVCSRYFYLLISLYLGFLLAMVFFSSPTVYSGSCGTGTSDSSKHFQVDSSKHFQVLGSISGTSGTAVIKTGSNQGSKKLEKALKRQY